MHGNPSVTASPSHLPLHKGGVGLARSCSARWALLLARHAVLLSVNWPRFFGACSLSKKFRIKHFFAHSQNFQRLPCVKGAVSAADWGIDFLHYQDMKIRKNAGKFLSLYIFSEISQPAIYAWQSLRHGFAAPPPFTQGRRWFGALSQRKEGSCPLVLPSLLYFSIHKR